MEITGLTEEYVKEIQREWLGWKEIPVKYKFLLLAVVPEEAQKSAHLQNFVKAATLYLWDPKIMRFRDRTTGRLVSFKVVHGLLDTMEKVRASTADDLAQAFIVGSITESQWRESTLALLRKVHVQATALSVGGYQQVTPKMLLQIEQAIAEDAVRMQGVNAQTPNLLSRVRLWVGNGRASYWRNQTEPPHNARTQEVLERRLIKAGDQCQFCIDQAALGWQALGVLSAPGTVPDPPPAQACYTNCRCTRERKVIDKADVSGWVGTTKSWGSGYQMLASNKSHVLLQDTMQIAVDFGAGNDKSVYVLWDREKDEVAEIGDLSDLLQADVWTWRNNSHMRTNLTVNSKGGPGSGNFGHAGRPGLVGGSGSNNLSDENFEQGYQQLVRDWGNGSTVSTRARWLEAASEEFGVDLPDHMTSTSNDLQEERKILRRIYEENQKVAPESLDLYRGTEEWEWGGTMNPITSWTSDRDTAKVYAQWYPGSYVVLNGEIPGTHLLSFPGAPYYVGIGVQEESLVLGLPGLPSFTNADRWEDRYGYNDRADVDEDDYAPDGTLILKTFREEDHPRVPDGPNAGQFTHKDEPETDDNLLSEPTYPQIARGKAKVEDRVWQGMPMVWDGAKPSKQEVGALGEKLAMQILAQKTGEPFEPVDTSRNNAPIDVWGDGMAVEVKTGLATNGRSAMHWRATIGQPGKEEMAAVEKLSKEEYKKHQDWKYKQILHRKHSLLADLNKAVPGRKLKGMTVGIIMHPSLEKADVYLMEGFHLVVGWKDNATDDNFIGTYNIKKQKKAQKAVQVFDEEFSEDEEVFADDKELSEEEIARLLEIRTIVLKEWQAQDEGIIERWVEKNQPAKSYGYAVKGGPGSGNFGHAGRPGLVGGSGEGGEAPASDADGGDGRPPWIDPIKRRKELEALKDSTEVGAWLKKRFPHLEVDISVMSLADSIAVVDQLSRLGEEYPTIIEGMSFVRMWSDEREGEGFSVEYADALAMAAELEIGEEDSGDWQVGILFSPAAFRAEGVQATIKNNQHIGWTDANGTVESLVSHEFGHLIEFDMGDNHTQSVLRYVSSQDRVGIVSYTYKAWMRDNYATRELSRYATTDPSEGFAEAFSALQHPNEHTRDLTYVKRLGALLNTVYQNELWSRGELQYIEDLKGSKLRQARNEFYTFVDAVGIREDV